MLISGGQAQTKNKNIIIATPKKESQSISNLTTKIEKDRREIGKDK